MKKILVPIDGSECSNMAIDKAKELAKVFASEVVLLYVSDSSSFQVVAQLGQGSLVAAGGIGTNAAPVAVPKLDQYKKSIHETAEKVLESGKARCAVLGDKVSAVLLEGRTADTIIDFIDANKDIDLVVMGSHGMSGFRRFFVGSVTHKVTVSIDRPILIVR